MELDKLSLFSMIKQRMAWATQRQEVLSRNLANADTPGYRPSDLKPLDFKKSLADVNPPQVAVTNPGHISGIPQSTASFRAVKDRAPEESSPTGNAVSLEEQMLKMGDTKGSFDLAANLYQKHIRMLKSAAGSGNR
jgi:flagellar basal-body rod protein FlgB